MKKAKNDERKEKRERIFSEIPAQLWKATYHDADGQNVNGIGESVVELHVDGQVEQTQQSNDDVQQAERHRAILKHIKLTIFEWTK